MSGETALLTFGIGPVHTFIAQARRVADVWAGSYVLSHLIRQAIALVRDTPGCTMVFPSLPEREIPDALPNRFVCRVPAAEADKIAKRMRDEVRRVWNVVVNTANRRYLEKYGLSPDPRIWDPNAPDEEAARFLDISWSWVPERKGYAAAAIEGARRYAASRMFRPFVRSDEAGEKCAICGERTALPNGDRDKVRRAWMTAEKKAEEQEDKDLARYLRLDQGRLCLVCAVKRLFPIAEGHQASFLAFDRFQPSEGEPRFALVMMDGDHMGSILSRGAGEVQGDLEDFHREVSEVLSRFAGSLRKSDSVDLNLTPLGYRPIDPDKAPQLIYAGGDDVLFICDPRDAIPVTRRLRDLFYVRSFDKVRGLLRSAENSFTISAAILFAHPAHPAGLLLRDLEDLLETEAKERAGRNAVAIRLAKRSGAPVDVVLPWESADASDVDWMSTLEELTGGLREGSLSSRQTFTLRLEERTLRGVFGKDPERWRPWLRDRLSRNEGMSGQAEELAKLVTPFFVHDRTAALRIARFLGREAER